MRDDNILANLPRARVWAALGVALWLAAPLPALEVIAEKEPSAVFGGGHREVRVAFHNSDGQNFTNTLSLRMHQASSATTIPAPARAWKDLQVAPGKTVIESVNLEFPDVRAKTRFLIQWVTETNRIVGFSDVWVYPTNLFDAFKTIANGEEQLGLFDPGNELKPLFQAAGLSFADLEETGTDRFHGRLAILRPARFLMHVHQESGERVRALARRGVAVVWIEPDDPGGRKLPLAFRTLPEHPVGVVLVQSEFLAGLAERPKAQLNLIFICESALNYCSKEKTNNL